MDPKKSGYQMLNSPPPAQSAVPSAPVLPRDEDPVDPRASTTEAASRRQLQVNTSTIISSSPRRAIAVPPPEYPSGPVQAHSLPRYSTSRWKLSCCVCTMLAIAGIIGAIYSALHHSGSEQPLDFSGIVPNNTCFNSSSIKVFPNADANFEGGVTLNVEGILLSPVNQTTCLLSFPGDVSRFLNNSLPALMSIFLDNSADLLSFVGRVFLVCIGKQPAQADISSWINAGNANSTVLRSMIRYRDCADAFSHLRQGQALDLSPL